MTDLQTTARETAALAVLEKYCIPKEGRADAKTHLAWLAGTFAQNPDLYENEHPEAAVSALLVRSCDPKGRYDGVTAWEIAGKVLEAMGAEAEEAVS